MAFFTGCGGGDSNTQVEDSIDPLNTSPQIDLGDTWFFLGDSQTSGRANDEPSAKSHHLAFYNVWQSTFSETKTINVSGSGGRVLSGTHSAYLGASYLSAKTLVHFQESGSQGTDQATPEEFVATFESFVRDIASSSPNAIISTETAFSFGPEREAQSGRNWTEYNNQMRTKISALESELGITIYLSEVDRNIKELLSRKGLLENTDGNVVWGYDDMSISYHYTGLGNLMVALSMYDAYGYDVSTLDLSGIADSEVSQSDKQLLIEIINYFNSSS